MLGATPLVITLTSLMKTTTNSIAMTEYEVRGLTHQGWDCGLTVLAKDPKHAILTSKELRPEMIRVISCLPADEWK